MSVSLNRRLLVTSTGVLALFLGLAGWSLDSAFQNRSESAQQDRLLAYVYALLGAAKEDEQGRLKMPVSMSDPRLNEPDSGIYAQVTGAADDYSWQSPSLLGRQALFVDKVLPGEKKYLSNEHSILIMYAIVWEGLDGVEYPYLVTVSLDRAPYLRESAAFRQALWWWLGGSALFLLLIQAALLRWGLAPLRRVAAEIKQIEAGQKDSLSASVPVELQGLSRNLNSLLRNSRATQDRYRNRLGDLAHSLKTPMAVMQSALDGQDIKQLQDATKEQLPRMNEILQYQLQRAAVSGRSTLLRPIRLRTAVERINATLQKVYQDKSVESVIHMDEDLVFRIDEGDWLEMLGNLMDNGYKHCTKRVRVKARLSDNHLQLHVEDDGPGIAAGDAERIVRRGERADEQHQGQGIGLSVVDEIVRLYGGSLSVDTSKMGGARITIRLPDPAY